MKLPDYKPLKIFILQHPLCWSVYITTRGKHEKICLAEAATRKEARAYAKDVRDALKKVNRPKRFLLADDPRYARYFLGVR